MTEDDDRDYSSIAYWEARAERLLPFCAGHRTLQAAISAAEEDNGEEKKDNDTTNEWYFDFRSLAPLLEPVLSPFARRGFGKDCEVLDIGCGVSRLFESLQTCSGLANATFTGIDLSPTVLAIMNRFYARNAAFHFGFVDARRLSTAFAVDSFDVIIDKATSDALLSAASEEGAEEEVMRMYTQVAHVLRFGGVFVICTVNGTSTPWFGRMLAALTGQSPPHVKWHIAVHSTVADTPNVYIIRKFGRELRRSTCTGVGGCRVVVEEHVHD